MGGDRRYHFKRNRSCIVGAASVLTKKYLTAHAIIAGNPGKVIRKNVDWKMSRI